MSRHTNMKFSGRIIRGGWGGGVIQSPGELWTGGAWVSCGSWGATRPPCHEPGAHSTTAEPEQWRVHIHPFIHRRWCQPCNVTTNTSGAGRVMWCLAQGRHLDTYLGGALGSNQQPSGCQITALISWDTAAGFVRTHKSMIKLRRKIRQLSCLRPIEF